MVVLKNEIPSSLASYIIDQSVQSLIFVPKLMLNCCLVFDINRYNDLVYAALGIEQQPWSTCWRAACSGHLSLLPSVGWEV